MNLMEHEIDSLSDVTLVLTEDESRQIHDVGAGTAAQVAGHDLDSEQVLTAAELAGHSLPARLVRALVAFRRTGNEFGTLVVVNLPVDHEVPSTPADGKLTGWHGVPVATMVQLAVSSHLGDVIAYADEKAGSLIQDVVPVAGSEDRQENSGTACLELHTEDGFHPFKPDFLTLLCLRPDHERRGRTLTGAVSRVLRRLSAGCIETLRQPVFRIRYSSSFSQMGTSGVSPPLAVLDGSPDDPDVVADFHAMEPMTDGARRAFDELRKVLEPALVGTVMDRGTLLVVDNRTAVHGRTAFTARHDGTDRWLRRCFTVADLRRSRTCRAAGSRVCAPLGDIGRTEAA